MNPNSGRESYGPENNVHTKRREYVKYLAAGASTAMLSLSGCLGPNFTTDQTISRTGRLPSHEVTEGVDKVAEATGGDSIGVDESRAVFEESGSTESSRLKAFVTGEDVNETGKVASSSTVSRATYWKAPKNGRYLVKSTYSGGGEFVGRLDCPEITDDKAMLFSSGHLAVLENPETEVASSHRIHMEHGDNGRGEMVNKVAKQLVEFAAKQILRRWLGPVAGIIAGQVVEVAGGYVSAAIDIVTGECYQFFLDLEYPDKSEYEIPASSPTTLSTTFEANEGEVYKIQFSPAIGSTLYSGVYSSQSRLAVESEYNLSDVSIKQV